MKKNLLIFQQCNDYVFYIYFWKLKISLSRIKQLHIKQQVTDRDFYWKFIPLVVT